MGIYRKTLKASSKEQRSRGEKGTDTTSTVGTLKNSERNVNLMRGFTYSSDGLSL
jgi:hypothetical protein